jgi:hypothetical protein
MQTTFSTLLPIRPVRFIFCACLLLLVDGSSRFFGFNARSPQQLETNYAKDESGYNFSAGYQIGRHLQVTLGDRFRNVEIHPGAFGSLPDIQV